MYDETFADKLPHVELDSEMAQRILSAGDGYSQGTEQLAQFILVWKARLRDRLTDDNLIQVATPRSDGFDLAAVDGGSALVPRGGGTLVTAAAYKTTINQEDQRGVARIASVPNGPDVAQFATLLRLHLEFLLLGREKLDADRLVVLDHSFWGIVQEVSRALAVYKTQRANLIASRRNPEYDAMQIAWRKLFSDSLGLAGSFLRMIHNKAVISLAKTAVSQFFVKQLLGAESASDPEIARLASSLNDRALLRHILKPGEYTTPQSLYRVEQESGDVKSWKRTRFATSFEKSDGPDPFEAREKVFDEYGLPRDARPGEEVRGRRLFVTYYLPHDWSRIYRIESHEAVLIDRDAAPDYTGHGERFQRVLASVRMSVNPEVKEPLCQVLADERAKAAASSAITLIPERAFYQLQDKYRENTEMREIIETLLSEERT